jgi:hypothetical protein
MKGESPVMVVCLFFSNLKEVGMEKLRKAKPNAHPSRIIFKINDVPLTEVSRALNLNYSYVCSMLAGSRHVPSHIDLKLNDLAAIVKEQSGKHPANERAITKDADNN